ncbi:hypothetical protein [Herbaspirillum robiniae]|uniref:hypothetical protein n=1 Tax=Herbaspirillum robiniae TaxID=2014887 RepID=UPI003D7719A4
MAVPVIRATLQLAAALHGLILLSSRAHGKAENYSLFKDLASKGFRLFVVWDATDCGFGGISMLSKKLSEEASGCFALETDKKNPETVVPGLIHTNEEGGGDIVTCCKNFR